jgi:hypothetical protein
MQNSARRQDAPGITAFATSCHTVRAVRVFFLAPGNPMNLASTGNTNLADANCRVTQCRGGWELIRLGVNPKRETAS